MQGYEVRFNVYADSQEEAAQASQAIKEFISRMASKGIPVTGRRIADAAQRWKDNVFVENYFR
jgi:hypothetical protein